MYSKIALVLAILIILILVLRYLLKWHAFARANVILGSLCLFYATLVIQLAISLFTFVVVDDEAGKFLLVNELLSYGKRSCTYLLPLLAIGYLALIVCNIILVKRHDYRIGNMLSVLVPCFLAICAIAVVAIPDWGYIAGISTMAGVQYFVGHVVTYLLCLLIATAICAINATLQRARSHIEYIIILGCRIFEDGRPSQILRRRLDRAIRFEQAQYRKTGRHATFIVSGGKGWGEATSEAKCMQDYLLEHKIPAKRIIVEDRAKTTRQNMIYSKQIIDEQKPYAEVAFCTTNYHLYRAGILARDAGFYYITGIGAKTSSDYYLNAILREFIGILDVAKLQLGIIIAMLVTLVVMGCKYIY